MRRIDQILLDYGHDRRGSNASTTLLQEIDLFKKSLGQSVAQIDPDLLIPRGDALRKDLTSYTDRDDLSDLAPISDKLLNELSKLISSYNNLVAFDPELARRDEALLGPDARKKLVPPTDGQDVIRQAVALKAAVQNVFDTLEEEARVAPASPDPESRQSRRYSEGVKNFSRIAVERASEYAQTAWTHKGKVIVGASGTFAASKWVDANREWLLNFFSENEIMSQIIRRLLDLIDLLPLA